MINWAALHAQIPVSDPLYGWITAQQHSGHCDLDPDRYGDLPRWLSAIDNLPDVQPTSVNFSLDAPHVTMQTDAAGLTQIQSCLASLHPWRKGPFDVCGIRVDAEWRSDFKWKRLRDSLSPLAKRRVLDVGCGNGYFCFRLLGEDATLALGIDPSPLFNVQFALLKRLYGARAAHLLPLPDTALSDCPSAFDTVMSMGVLYHRKSPFEHLALLQRCLRPGGELLLETLVVEGDDNTVLVPSDRYARMRNVWFLPSREAMAHWLQRAGFTRIRCVDDTVTTDAEQRSTDWMRFESHDKALDPSDSSRTIEGLPAPRRAAFVAERPA